MESLLDPEPRRRLDMVFGHNSLLPSNVLASADKSRVIFVDFETADMNQRGVDLTLFYQYDSESKTFGIGLDNDEPLKHYLRCYHIKYRRRLGRIFGSREKFVDKELPILKQQVYRMLAAT